MGPSTYKCSDVQSRRATCFHSMDPGGSPPPVQGGGGMCWSIRAASSRCALEWRPDGCRHGSGVARAACLLHGLLSEEGGQVERPGAEAPVRAGRQSALLKQLQAPAGQGREP